MKVVIVRQFGLHRGGNLNIRQILNPIFFVPVLKHPDRKRQHSTKRRDLLIWRARKIKGMQ